MTFLTLRYSRSKHAIDLTAMKILRLLLFAAALGWCELFCPAATVVRVPSTDASIFSGRPFLMPYPFTMRYQQVFSASAFRGVPSSDLYLSQMTILSDTAVGIDIGQLQVNLSTTPRGVDTLSTNFAENVGPDDTIVFGPGECRIYTDFSAQFQLVFQSPFIYRPGAGNLLIDVRVLEGEHWNQPYSRTLRGQNVPADEVSRAYADDVTAPIARTLDSGGFSTILWFYPVPSLRMYIQPVGSLNYFFIEWPTCPTVFRLQQSPLLGLGANWSSVPGASNDPSASFQSYWFPVGSVPPAFYRLYWNGGP